MLQILADHVFGKVVMTCRNRGVRGEDRVASYRLERSVKSQTAAGELPDSLKDQERGMPFVDMPHRRLQAKRCRARTPPMPSTSSCSMRVVRSPP